MKKSFNETLRNIEKKHNLLESTLEVKDRMIEEIEDILGFKHESWFSFSPQQLEYILSKLSPSGLRESNEISVSAVKKGDNYYSKIVMNGKTIILPEPFADKKTALKYAHIYKNEHGGSKHFFNEEK